jgi:hypothetical protein
MDNKSNDIYINIVKNPAWQPGSNQPIYIGPPNTDRPDKNWRLGAKINGQYYNQAAFPAKDKQGNKIEGGLLIKLEPSKSSKKNDFASTSSSGKDEYTF